MNESEYDLAGMGFAEPDPIMSVDELDNLANQYYAPSPLPSSPIPVLTQKEIDALKRIEIIKQQNAAIAQSQQRSGSMAAKPLQLSPIELELLKKQETINKLTAEQGARSSADTNGLMEDQKVRDSIDKGTVTKTVADLNNIEKLNYIQKGQDYIDVLKDRLKYWDKNRNVVANMDLSPLLAMTDQWSGNQYAKTYKPPESASERKAQYQELRERIAKAELDLSGKAMALGLRAKKTAGTTPAQIAAEHERYRKQYSSNIALLMAYNKDAATINGVYDPRVQDSAVNAVNAANIARRPVSDFITAIHGSQDKIIELQSLAAKIANEKNISLRNAYGVAYKTMLKKYPMSSNVPKLYAPPKAAKQ